MPPVDEVALESDPLRLAREPHGTFEPVMLVVCTVIGTGDGDAVGAPKIAGLDRRNRRFA